jgi:hypothetical protein
MKRSLIRTAFWMASSFGFLAGAAWADDKPAAVAPATQPAMQPTTQPTARPAPKPLSDNVKKGLAYLAHTQLPSGAWGQGDESATMGNTLDTIKSSPNVADTCMAVMAMVRSGSTPTGGEYQDQVLRAVHFVCGQIEASSASDLFITELRGTRTQMKLGSYIDTFMAAQLLAELKSKMPDAAGTKRVSEALAKVIKKIELNQKQDGRWAADGWAPVLAQAQCAKAINIAAQNGAVVNEKTRAAAEQVARADFANSSVITVGAGAGSGTGSGTGAGAGTGGEAAGGIAMFGTAGGGKARSGRAVATRGAGGDAGVELYSRSAQVAAMQASANTNVQLKKQYEGIANSATTQPAARAEALAMLKRFEDNDKDLAKAQTEVIVRLQDKQFVAGFGSNGGEEFLSYLNLGESLMLKGGDAWEKWDKSITDNINRIQNGDGSWTGHHCITGRTFCTSAALMVLTIDRTPVTGAGVVEQQLNK